MVGELLEAGLFVGFADSKTIIEWILFFKINTKDKIIKQMKEQKLNIMKKNLMKKIMIHIFSSLIIIPK